MRKHNTIKWTFMTIGFALLTLLLLLMAFPYLHKYLDMGESTMYKFLCSIVLIEILFLGIKNSLNHKRPKANKVSIVKKTIGWIVILLTLVGIYLSVNSLVLDYNAANDYANQFENHGSYYYDMAFDSYMEPILQQITGVQIIIPGLLLAWGYYLLKCGPLYSPKWKRWVKFSLYILITLIIAGNIITTSEVAWICMVIVFILMMIVVSMKTEYVDPSVQQIIEDIDL